MTAKEIFHKFYLHWLENHEVYGICTPFIPYEDTVFRYKLFKVLTPLYTYQAKDDHLSIPCKVA